jgi:hypothetical protein
MSQTPPQTSRAEVPARRGHVAHVLRDSFDVEQLCRMAAARLAQLYDDASRRVYVPQKFADAYQVLTSLPLSEDQFSVTSRRLANARNYLVADEWGAGQFELRQAARCIHSADR